MENINQSIATLWADTFGAAPSNISKLPQSGSDRLYYRVWGADGITGIATWNNNLKENATFASFSRSLRSKDCPVPELYAMNATGDVYLQSDFGDTSLLHELEAKGYNSEVYALFQQSLRKLAHLQIVGGEAIDYSQCLTAFEFGKQAIMSDLLYFKYYFLDTLKFPYDKQALLDDFDALSTYLTRTENKHFMFRDFQSRNIMVQDGQVHFIDYQGGMLGALQYDVASMLWQARADLPEQWKDDLLAYYIEEADKLLPQPLDAAQFTLQYNGYVLIRLLQVLGAYGFRGFFQRKAQFLTSIPLALRNLRQFAGNRRMGIAVPEFDKCIHFCSSDEVINRFEPLRAAPESPLQIKISSFSYKKHGIPTDDSGNGGGFVFDCRGILNPGRIDQYKTLTGKDKPVIDYLEQQTDMPIFLNSVFDLVDITVTDYIKRGFSSLQINFGCTGGQHRSVYAAEQTARHLRNKFGVRTAIVHYEQPQL